VFFFVFESRAPQFGRDRQLVSNADGRMALISRRNTISDFLSFGRGFRGSRIGSVGLGGVGAVESYESKERRRSEG
jgi:hypothetical protein